MPTLEWLNRKSAVTAAARVPGRILQAVPELGAGEPAAENMLIQGDNLDALKALLPFCAGRVKCIYIDPPYNTGSAFEHYDDNVEHSTWLSLMFPRLVLLRDLLAEDGSIWVSIDDTECHYLKVIMDEVFGRGNFLTNFIWQKSYGGGAKARYFVGLHEHLLCYAKNLAHLPDFFWPPDKDVLKYYKLKDAQFAVRGPYRLQPLATTSNDARPNLRYPIMTDDGKEIWPEKQWQWAKERVAEARKRDEIVIVARAGKYTVSYKQYLRDDAGEERRAKPKSIIAGHFTQHGTYESMELFGLQQKFAFPKPEGLIAKVFDACTNPGDLVLDSFLGSGTTAAVALKMGRRFIGIEMGEHAVTHCAPRLRKVIEGEQGGISEAVGWKGGGGFRFYRLGPTIFDESGGIRKDIRFPELAAHVWFCETRTPLAESAKPNALRGAAPNTPAGGVPPPAPGTLWAPPAAKPAAGARPSGVSPEPPSTLGADATPRAATPGAPPSPLLGVHEGKAVYLLYNGILGDRRPQGGNVLTSRLLRELPPHDGPKIVYGECTRMAPETLRTAQIVFKQIPYDIRGE